MRVLSLLSPMWAYARRVFRRAYSPPVTGVVAPGTNPALAAQEAAFLRDLHSMRHNARRAERVEVVRKRKARAHRRMVKARYRRQRQCRAARVVARQRRRVA